MANIAPELEQDLKSAEMNMVLQDSKDPMRDDVLTEEADEIIIFDYSGKAEDGIGIRTLKLPKKKLVDFEWVQQKIAPKRRAQLKPLVEEAIQEIEEGNELSCYATSYGVGVSYLFNSKERIQKIVSNITRHLESYGIPSRIEFSDARWVLRIVIPNSYEVRERLQNLK